MTRTLTLPFAHLNLRFNPFGELDSADRIACAIVDVEPLVERMRRPGAALQFLGECGRGKTTHLLALHARFPGAPYIRVHEGESPRVPDAPAVFVDDADLLPRRRWGRLLRRKGALAVTTHADLGAETVRVNRLDEERLDRLVRRRIEHARRAPGPVPVVGPGAVARLLRTFGDDIRAMELRLYDVFQELGGICDVQV